MDTREKIISRAGLHEVLEEHRRAGHRIVFAHGAFGLLHAGQVRFLASARAEGDVLVAAIHSDASLQKIDREHRPMLTERARAVLVAALAAVDYVILADESDVKPLLREFRPDVYACCGESNATDDEPRALGIRVAFIENGYPRSTGDIIARVRQGANG